MIKKKFNVSNALFIGFFMFILLLGLPSMIALCPSLYFSESKKTDAHLYLDDADYLYENVHGFLLLRNPLADDFTALEASHMRDVRFIFGFFYFVSLLFFLLLVSYLIFVLRLKNIKRRKLLLEEFFSSLMKGAVMSLIVLLFLIIFSFVNFSSSFDVFHQIFFPQGNWSFPADSLLITLFPLSFFINISSSIFFYSFFFFILMIIVLFFVKRKLLKK
jgi:integral membrane protein (TIGR01906 family)